MTLQDVLNILVQEGPVRCSVVLCTSSLLYFCMFTVVCGITNLFFCFGVSSEHSDMNLRDVISGRSVSCSVCSVHFQFSCISACPHCGPWYHDVFWLAFGYELATRILYISAGSACELFSLFCALPV